MCVVSAVFDRWQDQIPHISPFDYQPFVPYSPSRTDNSFDWKKLFEEFKEEVKKAKEQDKAEGNPNCEDPDKAKLEQRVKELEELLASGVEFVLVKRQNMQPVANSPELG